MTVRTKQRKGCETSSQGFTLIELLVVIAIIAILAAILFPVFAKAREKARQTVCLSDTKQIGLALMQYTGDYDECVAYLWYGAGGGGTTATGCYKWMDAVYPYVKSEAVFNCPDATFPYVVAGGSNFYQYKYKTNLAGAVPAAAGDNAATGNFYYGTYGYNAMYRNDPASSGRTAPCGHWPGGQSSTQYAVPASTVWIAEGANYTVGWSTYATQPATIVNHAASPIAFNGNGNELVMGRHSDFANVIFCDGHVKAMTLDELGKKNSQGTLYYFTIQDDALL